MARYIKQEMPDLNGTGETKCYYRLEKRRNLSTKEFLKKAGAHGILDDGILKHALQAYYKPFRVIDYGKIHQARDARPQWYW